MPTNASRSVVRSLFRRFRSGCVRRVAVLSGIDTLAPPTLLEMPEGRRLMVIAPHPDDESIGCGGLVSKWSDAGREVVIVFLTDGGAGLKYGETEAIDVSNVRREEAMTAARILGSAQCVFLGLPDGQLSNSLPALIQALEDVFSRYRPDVVALPHVTDRHPDHTAVAPAVLRAAAKLPASAGNVTFLGYEIWSPVQASVVIDITAHAERKAAAINAHASQVEQRDYAESALALNRYRACSSLLEGRYAEAFWMGGPAELASLRAQVGV